MNTIGKEIVARGLLVAWKEQSEKFRRTPSKMRTRFSEAWLLDHQEKLSVIERKIELLGYKISDKEDLERL